MAPLPKDKQGAPEPLRSGLICPRCRRELDDEEPSSLRVPRCAECDHAFVEFAALAEADGDPFLGKAVAGRYVILARLGAGSMGTVYKARQEAMGRNVAVKILRSERLRDAYAKARFVREARAMSLLTSPHTVTVFDFGEIRVSDGSVVSRSAGSTPPPSMSDDFEEEDERSLFLAMEMLEGESLGQRLRRSPRLDVERAAEIARQALLSLAEAHDKGVIHRDLKPDNLFLTRETSGFLREETGEHGETCKVLDFGIAKVVSDRSRLADALETQAGTVFGTPRYMSPEQAQGRSLDARSDLYTLGVLLYHMVVGSPPFVDEDAVVVMAHHIRSAPEAPSLAAPEANIPKPISDLILRALSKDPSDRPASARAFIEELDAALEASRRDRDREASVPSDPSRRPGVSTPPTSQRRLKTSSLPPPTPRASAIMVRELDTTRDVLAPNSLSTPPPSVRAGLKPALVVLAAVAVGVLGGAVAFGLVYPPARSPFVAAVAQSSRAALELAPRLRDAANHLGQASGKAGAAEP